MLGGLLSAHMLAVDENLNVRATVSSRPFHSFSDNEKHNLQQRPADLGHGLSESTFAGV